MSRRIAPTRRPLDRRRTTPAGRRRNAGFTLLEALVAGVLLALVGLMIAGGVTQSLRATGTAAQQQTAAELLDHTLTKIDMIGPARLASEGPTSGGFEPPHEQYQWSAQIETRAELDLYDVRVVVSWPSPSGVQSEAVHTYLYDPTGSRDDTLQWGNL